MLLNCVALTRNAEQEGGETVHDVKELGDLCDDANVLFGLLWKMGFYRAGRRESLTFGLFVGRLIERKASRIISSAGSHSATSITCSHSTTFHWQGRCWLEVRPWVAFTANSGQCQSDNAPTEALARLPKDSGKWK